MLPQTTKARYVREMLAKLKRNDEVVTAGGLLGRINEIGDKVIVLEIAPNARVRVERGQITGLSSYGKPPAVREREGGAIRAHAPRASAELPRSTIEKVENANADFIPIIVPAHGGRRPSVAALHRRQRPRPSLPGGGADRARPC